MYGYFMHDKNLVVYKVFIFSLNNYLFFFSISCGLSIIYIANYKGVFFSPLKLSFKKKKKNLARYNQVYKIRHI